MAHYNYHHHPNSAGHAFGYQSQQQGDGRVLAIFQAVDRDRNGVISEDELQEALTNGTSHPFNPETVRIMTTMFDQNYSGNIELHEFASLFKFVSDWQNIFYTFDRDRSGSIDKNELKTALQSFGYNLSDRIYNILLRKFDRHGTGVIFFDDFIHCCVTLEKISSAFRAKDVQRRGLIDLSFEEFLSLSFSMRM